MEPWLLITLLIVIILPLFFLITTTSTKQNLPPGPRKLPLIGNLHQLVFSNGQLPSHRLFAKLAKAYGPIMHLQIGEVPMVVVSSADAAKEFLKTHDAVCCSRPPYVAAKEIYYNYTNIGMAPYGEYWRQVRKISTVELFTSKRVESFRPIRAEEVGLLRNEIASQTGQIVNLSTLIFALTFNIITRITLCKKGSQIEAFHAYAMEVVKIHSGLSIAELYPSSKLVYLLSGMGKKLKEIVQQGEKILDPIIEEHMVKKKNDDVDKDLVDILLNFHKDNIIQGANNFLTTENIKAVMLDVFGGGTETSSTTVEWAMSELIKNPIAMAKAQDEVRQTYQVKGFVDESNLDKLKYLKMVIKETLRLHPPLPLLAPREFIGECKIQGYDMPLKTRVLINAWAIGRDPNYWKEPESFIPERFEDSLIDFKGGQFEFIPFGGGRRMCPGMSLGLINVELPLAMLLYHFDWKLPPGKSYKELDMYESVGITARRKNELLVIPTAYP